MQSLDSHSKAINTSLNQIVARVESLKTIPVTANGEIKEEGKAGSRQSEHGSRKKMFS